VKNELIIVRIGEIALKAKQTRMRFENILISNINKALVKKNISFKIKREWGRIFVYTNRINKSIEIIKKIFGITSISPAVKTYGDIESISKLAVCISQGNVTKNDSFALRVERTGNHSFSSQDVAVRVGNDIVQATKSSVDLTKPDFELFIEIRNDDAYLFTNKIPCNGGLPLKSQGNVLVFVDNKNSFLASWYIMRRGCKPFFIINNKSFLDDISNFINKWFAEEEFINYDSKKPIYDFINETAQNKKCHALVTGHSLYGNSENVLSEIKLLTENLDIPIFHPLIAMDKDEIQKMSKKIGVFQ